MMDPLQWLGEVGGAIVGAIGSVAGTVAGVFMQLLGVIIDTLANMAAAVLELLPDAQDLGLAIPGGWLQGYATMNAILPLSEALTFFALLVGLRAAVTLWHLGVTAYHLIPKPLSGT